MRVARRFPTASGNDQGEVAESTGLTHDSHLYSRWRSLLPGLPARLPRG
eukprot:COSAG02_NODE_5888_length_3960_cov_2.066822_2_plen_49_part_00